MANVNNNNNNNNHPGKLSGSIDNYYRRARKEKNNNHLDVDLLDINIIKELIADPDIQNTVLAMSVNKPLSTVQRRKNDLEKSGILRKNYEASFQGVGWRNAEILMLVDKGKADHMATELIEKFDKVIGTSIRLNTQYNLAAYVGYRYSNELHELMETIRAMPSVKNIEWSEIVREVGNKNHRLVHLVFDSLREERK